MFASLVRASLVLAGAVLAIDEVLELPGYGRPEERTLAGFVEANKTSNANLWYMFFEKQGGQADDKTPLVVWLNGGPGASSSLGNFVEHGPYRLQANGSMTRNPSAWNKLAHVVYFDNPVGTGFSYCDKDGYVTNMEQLAEQFSTGLLHFFQLHPEYKANPLYMAGESYAGVYIPAISAHIITSVPQLKLTAVLIGNPGNFHYTQYKGQIEFAESHGLIGDIDTTKATELWNQCDQLMERNYTVLAFKKCEEMSSYIFDKAGNPFLYNVEQWGDLYDDVLAPVMQKYFATSKVQDALHVGNHTWMNGDGTSAPNPVVIALNKTLMDSSMPHLQTILEHGVPLRIYDGVLDGSSCNHISVFGALRNYLQWSGRNSFFTAERKLWKKSGSKETFGYTKAGGGLTFVWVSNSGHLVPLDQPEAGLDLLRVFLEETKAEKKAFHLGEGAGLVV